MENPFSVHRRRNVQSVVPALSGVAFLLTLFACGGGPPEPGPAIPATPEQTEAASVKSLVPFQQLGPGDVLEVIVRRGAGEERYAPTIREDGTVTVSFVDVPISGLSPGQAAEKIQGELEKIIREPRVEVVLTKKAVSTQKVLVLGQVKKPGIYPLERNQTVLQAILQAEGANETALLEEVRIIRNETTDPVILAADVDQLINKGDLSQNLVLQQNDIVYVPRTKIGNWNAFLEQIRPSLDVLIAMPLHSVYEAVVINELLKN